MAKTPLSFDPDKADKSGFLHGTRALIKKFRCVFFNYANKDGVVKINDDGSEVRAPGFMVDFQTKGGDQKVYNQFYSNGSSDQRAPNKAGTGFIIPAGSAAKSALQEGSNAYLLMAAMKGCGWPTDQLNAGDTSLFEGAEVDLIAQPIAQNSRARAEGTPARTIAVVGKIVSFPGGAENDEDDDDADEAPVKKVKKAKAEPDEDEEDADEEDAEVEEDEEEEADDDEAEAEEDPLTVAAQEYVATVLADKRFRDTSIPIATLAIEVTKLAKGDKLRSKILALVQSPDFHKTAPWTFDRKAKAISAEE